MLEGRHGGGAAGDERQARRAAQHLRRWLQPIVLVVGAVGVLCAVLGMSFYPPLDRYPPIVLWGFGFGLLVLAVMMTAATVAKRKMGAADSPETKPRIVWLGLLPSGGCIALGFGATLLVNGVGDPHLLEKHEVVIVRKYVSGTGSNRRQNIIVPDWRREGETLNVPPGDNLWDQTEVGGKLVVVVGPGLFAPWLARVRLP